MPAQGWWDAVITGRQEGKANTQHGAMHGAMHSRTWLCHRTEGCHAVRNESGPAPSAGCTPAWAHTSLRLRSKSSTLRAWASASAASRPCNFVDRQPILRRCSDSLQCCCKPDTCTQRLAACRPPKHRAPKMQPNWASQPTPTAYSFFLSVKTQPTCALTSLVYCSCIAVRSIWAT